MRTLLPIFFVVVAIGVFIGYIDPTYKRVQELREEARSFDDALTRSKELQRVRDELISRYNVIPPQNLDRLGKMLPDNIDNVRLILDIDSIAARYGMRTRNVQLQAADDRPTLGQVGQDDRAYQSVILSFSVSASYEEFLRFMADLERSLRLVDVVGVSFSANETGIYDYSVSIKTYWLKP
jgi:Tfp pilus assembly protein PilO